MSDDDLVPEASGIELAGLTRLFQRLATSQHDVIDALATSLGAALPDAVAVQRKGLFNSGRAHTLQIHTGDEVFELRDQRGQITAQIGRSVGGVVISHEATTIDHWLQRLRAALEQSARQSVTMAEALSRLL